MRIQPEGCSASLPAAGYRNGADLKNAGTNGNYWSSSVNESNPNNAYNFNFNSGDHDWNNNNRYYGQSVRAVTELTRAPFFSAAPHLQDGRRIYHKQGTAAR